MSTVSTKWSGTSRGISKLFKIDHASIGRPSSHLLYKMIRLKTIDISKVRCSSTACMEFCVSKHFFGVWWFCWSFIHGCAATLEKRSWLIHRTEMSIPAAFILHRAEVSVVLAAIQLSVDVFKASIQKYYRLFISVFLIFYPIFCHDGFIDTWSVLVPLDPIVSVPLIVNHIFSSICLRIIHRITAVKSSFPF